MKINEKHSEAMMRIEPTQVAINYGGTGFAPTVKISISGLVTYRDEQGEHTYWETFYSVEDLIDPDGDFHEEGHVDRQEVCMGKVSERLAELGYRLGAATNKWNTYFDVLHI